MEWSLKWDFFASWFITTGQSWDESEMFTLIALLAVLIRDSTFDKADLKVMKIFEKLHS